ncbi:MAG: type III pantothenate kinase [Anaerofustis stercorihominis]|nr:type III pantothenate kinase [Anaerofustis stercorihominis]
MLLAVNVRNSVIDFGVFDKRKNKGLFSLTTEKTITPDELSMKICWQLEFSGLKISDITDVIISSVEPEVNAVLTKTFERFGLESMYIAPGIKTGLKLRSDDPREIGSDRIIDAVAAHDIYGSPAIVISFGTATRFDYVAKDGIFSHAITAPGILSSARSLWESASKLPKVELKKPKKILASNTVSSMQSGIMYGFIGLTKHIVEEMKKEIGIEGIKVILSGQYAHYLADELDFVDVYDEMLSMKGLVLIHEKNKR